MDLNQTVLQLAAAADPTRLRLLAALLHGEAPVGELVAMLGQSQPRVSRHLRLLTEAGLVEGFREGRSIHYRWTDASLDAGLAATVAAMAAAGDTTLAADRARLARTAAQRERDALRRVVRAGGRPAPDSDAALGDLLQATLGAGDGDATREDILVVGCGGGELLRLLLPRARVVTGTEVAGPRRQLARARLRAAGTARWTVREAGPAALPFADRAFDLVVLQDALAAVDAAGRRQVLAEAGRVLRPGGRLLLLDRLLPTDRDLAPQLEAAGFTTTRRRWLPGRAPDRALLLATWLPAAPARTGTHD